MDDGISFKAFMYSEEGAKAEIRRFNMEKHLCGKIRTLTAKLREVYPKLKSKEFTVAWKDEDGDEVIISSDEEVYTMYHQTSEVLLRLIVRVLGPRNDGDSDTLAAEANLGTKDPQSVHQGITCDGCDCSVVGFRYKCITCDDFDLCVRCENEGKHPEHCVVRVPTPNMPLPLIKATIKKSRRFLKSVASQAHEESKRIRRERVKHGSDSAANNQGKQDSQSGAARNWVSVFGTYLEEFTNLAGDIGRQISASTEKKPEPGNSMPEKPAETEYKIPSAEEISINPWHLSEEDLEKLNHACKFMEENTHNASLKPLTMALHKVLEIAAKAAKQETANSPARASSPIREVLKQKINRETVLRPEPNASLAEEAALFAKDAPKIVHDTLNIMQQSMEKCYKTPTMTNAQENVQETPKEEPEPSMSGLRQKSTVSGKKTSLGTAYKSRELDVRSISDLMNAIIAARTEMASDTSSCSSGHGSTKAEGWTMIDDPCDEAKDLLLKTEEFPNNDMPEPDVPQEYRYVAPIYPPLNAATAVLDPKEADVAPAASAPPMPKTDAKPATAKPAPMTQTPMAKPSPNTKPVQKTSPLLNNPNTTHAAETIEAAQTLRSQLAPHVEAALRQMEGMGFSNQSGWLTQLLYHHDGNIPAVLDLLTPSAPQPK